MSHQWNTQTLTSLLQAYNRMAGSYQTKIGRLAREHGSNRAEIGLMLARAKDMQQNVLETKKEDGKLVTVYKSARAWGSD